MGLVRRGEIWLTRLDPTVGSEIRKIRPCLVVSPPAQNRLQTVMIVPLTTKGRPAPYRPNLIFDGKAGLVLTDQLRSVDRSRLQRFLGRIDDESLAATLAILRDTFKEAAPPRASFP